MAQPLLLALAWLAFTESRQRRVLVAFMVFVVLMMFASWFLKAEGGYVSFVFTASTWLVLGLVLILTTFRSVRPYWRLAVLSDSVGH